MMPFRCLMQARIESARRAASQLSRNCQSRQENGPLPDWYRRHLKFPRRSLVNGRSLVASMMMALFLLASCGQGPAAGRVAITRTAEPKIGMVLDVGGRADLALNRTAYDGVLRLAESLRGWIAGDPAANFGGNIDIRVLETDATGSDRETLLRSLAEEGRNLVIAVGFFFSTTMAAIARDFPDTDFLLIDGYTPDLTTMSNIVCAQFAEQESAFMAGAFAGRLAAREGPTAKVGFVGGMDMPIMRKHLAGFSAGAAWTNRALQPTGAILSAFVGRGADAFADPKRAAEFASALFQTGNAVIIYQAAGASGKGVFNSAARFGRKALGSDADQAMLYAASGDPDMRSLAPLIVMSTLKRVDKVIYDAGFELASGFRLVGGYRTYTLADGGVGYTTEGIEREDLVALSGIAHLVVDGDIIVPTDAVETADFLARLR
ncbi:MAG: BMP family ABC transporter substrate-binding protein [Spirochaetales bacterium]|nr:MAG: BMP family ABC transporter substrate-binding protein [Spirochaetales bacterium]